MFQKRGTTVTVQDRKELLVIAKIRHDCQAVVADGPTTRKIEFTIYSVNNVGYLIDYDQEIIRCIQSDGVVVNGKREVTFVIGHPELIVKYPKSFYNGD